MTTAPTRTKPVTLPRGPAGQQAAALEQLSRALVGLADDGRRTPCQDPQDWRRWLSEDPETLDQAAAACQGCPVFDKCKAAGQFQTGGVWAGQDRTRPMRRRNNGPAVDRRAALEKLAPVVLGALATASQPPTLQALQDDATDFTEDPDLCSRARVIRALDGFRAAGQVERLPGRPRTYALTPAGLEAAEGALGGLRLQETPSGRLRPEASTLPDPETERTHEMRKP